MCVKLQIQALKAHIQLCRQGSVIPFTSIRGPDAWLAKEYRHSERHIYNLSQQNVAELDAAVAAAKATGKAIKVNLYQRAASTVYTDQRVYKPLAVMWQRSTAD